ncbi:MAG TPA: hypothetical protein VLV50_09995 [Stellaceae bacterium]|nr:hypothetical protein [Stellaceae bacterium]
MKLYIAMGMSLLAALAGTSVAWRVDVLSQPPWLAPTLSTMLAATGGPGGFCLLLYALISCTILAASALYALRALASSLEERTRSNPKRLPEAWRAALEKSDFAPLAGPITGDELAIAPLALLRVLRAEIWRVFIKRLVASQTVTVALAAAALAFGPDLVPGVTLAPALVLRIDALAAGVVLAGGVAASLLLDRAIERFAAAITRLSAAWERSNAPLAVTAAAAPAPASAVAPMVPTRSAGPSGAQVESLAASVDRLAGLLAGSAERQSEALAELSHLMTGTIETVARALDRAESLPPPDSAAAGTAMAQLTAALEQFTQPVMEQMKLLGASDRRLIAMLRRQEEVVGALGLRWSELVTSLQSMSANLASAALASRNDPDPRLLAPVGREGAASVGLEDELQELLDEMSGYDGPEEDPGRVRG